MKRMKDTMMMRKGIGERKKDRRKENGHRRASDERWKGKRDLELVMEEIG